VQDIIARPETVISIKETLTSFKKKVQKTLQKAQLGKLKSQPGKGMMDTFEASVNQNLNAARDKSGNLALDDLQSYNRLKNMVFAGSKGSNINIS
jgi:DNA-directed RNA polymerase II subunit RPB1